MKKREDGSLKFSMKKLSCFILSMVLIISFSVMSVPLTVSAQTNELSDTNISSTQLENTLRTYFMVVSTYNITSTTGRLSLSVNKTS